MKKQSSQWQQGSNLHSTFESASSGAGKTSSTLGYNWFHAGLWLVKNRMNAPHLWFLPPPTPALSSEGQLSANECTQHLYRSLQNGLYKGRPPCTRVNNPSNGPFITGWLCLFYSKWSVRGPGSFCVHAQKVAVGLWIEGALKHLPELPTILCCIHVSVRHSFPRLRSGLGHRLWRLPCLGFIEELLENALSWIKRLAKKLKSLIEKFL